MKADIYCRADNGQEVIEISYGSESRNLSEVAMVPYGFQSVRLVHQDEMRKT